MLRPYMDYMDPHTAASRLVRGARGEHAAREGEEG